ncbi:autotransporter outer membrane beta-barrel domain-containing protein [Tardiphaga sp. 768_D3_N2_1]|uniref:autotransporter outer membrane beta-barrel domain-containing protein n=1 Tax=Tardiphaga sp. 768_D3_N2_1 TaxID=3240783 RepID=UPI003F886AD5
MSARSTISAIGRPRRYLTNASHLALAIGCVALVGIALPGPAAAATNWTGANSPDWFDPTNWDNGIPTAGTNFTYIDTTSSNPTLISGGSAAANSMSIGHTNGNSGMLTISNGGVLNSGQALLGDLAGSTGTATVTGPGAIWNATNVVVGSHGTGTLSVLNGGKVLNGAGYGVFLGSSAGSSGLVTVDGSGSTLSGGDIVVGDAGNGTLMVSNGGTVLTTQFSSIIGKSSGSIGNATITGADSSWVSTGTGDFWVGQDGTGTLTIANGGKVSVASNAVLGYQTDGVGTVTVTGAGSVWNTQAITIGRLGTGTLNILNGAAVATTPSPIVLGDQASGIGTVNVDGAGSILTGSSVVVGNSGAGTLMVSNGATVRSTSFTSYIGQNAGSVGTATITGPGSRLMVENNALVVGEAGNGALTIANGALVSVSGSTLVGSQAGSVGTINIGGSTGAAAVAPGTLDSAAVFLGNNGVGTINFNHTSTSYTFAPEMFGTGSINQIAGTTILTADSSGLTGATNITGGRLAVNGSLAGSIVTVSGGGILGGTGTVGGIVANSGGIVGPGNSIGTLNVNGNVSFAPGSIYQVETNAAGQSDRIAATGSATLNGGTVIASGAAPIGTTYTILTANGGITGAFAGASGPSVQPFLAYGLTYDSTSVYLGITRSNLAFAAAGLTRNQIAAGSGADSLPLNSALVGSLAQLDLPQARRAFDQISGEAHASAKGVMIEDSRFLREAAIDRLRAAFDGVGAAAAPVTTYVNGRPVLAPATTDGVAVWGRGFGSWGQWNGDGNAATVKRDIGGFMVGVDAPFVDGWRVGAIGGYSRSTFRVADRASSGSSDNYHGGLYGGTQWGDFAFRSGLAYTRHDLSINRSVGFPGVAEMLRGDYSAGTTQAFGDFGYRIGAARTPFGPLAFEPFANLAYVNLATDGFTERGGVAALTSRSDNTGVTFTTLGLRASTGVDLGSGMTATVRGMLGWRHAFGDVTPTSIVAFAGGSPFTVAGVPIAANAAVADLGFDVNVTPNATLGVTYGGQFGSGVTDQTLRGNFAVRF